jgi:hypothetical protein
MLLPAGDIPLYQILFLYFKPDIDKAHPEPCKMGELTESNNFCIKSLLKMTPFFN